mmetsp:Transcript_215/g.505  ORF Transcript_215/g.505 Transcript_215/m.505 type:complete len:388 (+) Transcript_215:285-1448(+)
MPHVEIPQAEFKAVVLGDSHIGKTSLVTRFAEGYYRENSRPATVGAFFVTKRIQSTENNIPTKIQIWDTAGAESFRAMAPMFYKNAAAVVVCYDVTRRDSFEGMREWLAEVRRKVKVGEEVVVAIAALKTDLLQQDGSNVAAAVPEYEVEQLAEALGCIYLPTSAKTNHNVEALFQEVANRVIRNQQNRLMNANDGQGTAVGDGDCNDGNAVLADRNDLSYANGINGGSSPRRIDDRINIASPRKRDEFDKFYVSKNNANENNDDNNQARSNNASLNSSRNDASIHSDKQNDPSRGGGQNSNKKKGQHRSYKGNNRSTIPSTDETIITSEGDHPLLAKHEKKKNKNGGTNGSGTQDQEGLCYDDSLFACQPVACGTTEGNSYGCVLQ